MQQYDLKLEFSPGKELLVADTLSRAYNSTEPNATCKQRETVHMNLVRKSCPVSDELWGKMARTTTNDEVPQKFGIKFGWSLNSFPAPHGNFTDGLSVIL